AKERGRLERVSGFFRSRRRPWRHPAVLALGAVVALALPRPDRLEGQTAGYAVSSQGVEARVSPPVPIEGLPDVRPMAPLEFSRAWLSKAERVRRTRAELRARGKLDGADPAELAAQGAALSGTL